ncbi:hypothetical protein [Salsipaludibacter albus]|uniref:hypothetical protein n=1 Tax=Salsipaludibacter albus TaxID=2849650 RepID=UPI001EE49B06|nr:hypothetical protein [Salsipaludibacter albus]MBY5163238.1 hypothetical protein [Salsipaludibacter albus]
MGQPTTVHVYARTEFAEPLEHLRDVDADDPADLSVEDATGGGDWLEVAVVPADRLVWVIRDGELVDRAHEEVPA